MNHLAIIDSRMPCRCKESLETMGFQLIEIQENPRLDAPVSAHPDISVFKYKNYIAAEYRCYLTLKEHLFSRGNCPYSITAVDAFDDNTRYPFDCTLNFASVGEHIIGNLRYINPTVRKIAEICGLKFIDVKQGYAKCNICVVSDHALITEDKGIAKECRKYGIDVLLLGCNCVTLKGYKNGFIGGASGTVCSDLGLNKILFCGDITAHPEYKAIALFCKQHGAVPISLSDELLYDCGSIIIL